MKHPNPKYQRKQEEFLKSCPVEHKEYFAANFRIGNAIYVYHEQALSTCDTKLKVYYEEWLQGLPPKIAVQMKELGIKECFSMYPFTRYVNERNDLGLRDWLREHLSKDDFDIYTQSGEDYKGYVPNEVQI